MDRPCLHYECTNRNSFGSCKTTACINYKYSKEWIESTTNCSPNAVFKPVTNADKIRAMSDEELAEKITDEMHGNIWCEIACSEMDYVCDGACEQHVLKWLKEEVKE